MECDDARLLRFAEAIRRGLMRLMIIIPHERFINLEPCRLCGALDYDLAD